LGIIECGWISELSSQSLRLEKGNLSLLVILPILFVWLIPHQRFSFFLFSERYSYRNDKLLRTSHKVVASCRDKEVMTHMTIAEQTISCISEHNRGVLCLSFVL
jgi:hypothetical protein